MNNVYTRLALYGLTFLLSLIPAWAIGMVELQTLATGTHALVIHVEAVIGAAVTALGANVGIFAKWGVK